MYKLSKDYDELYRLACEGNIIVAFVDYNDCRDICKVQRRASKAIEAGVRGCCYFGVYAFQLREKTISERERFIKLCETANLEWIVGE